MKSLFTVIGCWVGIFIALMICSDDTPPIIGIIIAIGGAFGGRFIASQIEEEKENERKQKEEYERRRWQEERERERKVQRRSKAQILAKRYPEATKHYFKQHWNISKSYVSDYDITDDKVDTLLSHEYEYERDEQKYNLIYRQKIEAEKEAKRREEREAAERKRRKEELARKRKEEEMRNLPTSLPACVTSWSSHSNSSLKHKYFFDYYSYGKYKDNASASMWETWRTVWHFKNDPDKNVTSYEHRSALQTVINLVENALRSAFGSKTEYLTLVCLTASTQRKTELRFKDFAEQVCKDLNMNNAYPHIQVIEGGSAKHDGGDGYRKVSYDRYFFSGKYVVLFDDVRTTGHSLEQERRTMEELGAKVICAVTIAQTTY